MVTDQLTYRCDAPGCDSVTAGREYGVRQGAVREEPYPPDDWSRIADLLFCPNHQAWLVIQTESGRGLELEGWHAASLDRWSVSGWRRCKPFGFEKGV